MAATAPRLNSCLATAAASCRQTRRELSLLLLELDGYDNMIVVRGVTEAERIRQAVLQACRTAGSPQFAPLDMQGGRIAVVLPGYDRPAAADVGHQILREVRQRIAGGGVVSVSVGASTVAIPAKNFDPLQIITSAERCLRAAQLSGGGCFKSIEAY